MTELVADLWWVAEQNADAVCITTNGTITRGGRGVMGRGVALQATQRYPRMRKTLGAHLVEHGNHVGILLPGPPALVSFPVKREWHEAADLDLIERSTHELLILTQDRGWTRVVLPRPGCGNGRRQWETVKPILADYLNDRFVVVTR